MYMRCVCVCMCACVRACVRACVLACITLTHNIISTVNSFYMQHPFTYIVYLCITTWAINESETNIIYLQHACYFTNETRYVLIQT